MSFDSQPRHRLRSHPLPPRRRGRGQLCVCWRTTRPPLGRYPPSPTRWTWLTVLTHLPSRFCRPFGPVPGLTASSRWPTAARYVSDYTTRIGFTSPPTRTFGSGYSGTTTTCPSLDIHGRHKTYELLSCEYF